MPPLVSITLVTWNRWHLFEQCLRSIARQTYAPYEVIVVDQGSSDGTTTSIAQQFPHVTLIRNTTNTLYCHGQNQAIRASRGVVVLALNNDVVLHPAFLTHAVAAMDTAQRIGMVCGKVLSWDARHLDGAGQALSLACHPTDRGYRQRDAGQFDQAAEVFGPGGAAPLYRRDLLEDVAERGQYFDEQLGCFYEDLDLAWRAQRRGWKARYTPQAVAYHYRGATAQGPRPRLRWLARFDLTALPPHLQHRFLTNRQAVLRKTAVWKCQPWRWPWMLAYEASARLGLWLSCNPSPSSI